ncbi:unnamed protein product [Ascophyllum nodosum]
MSKLTATFALSTLALTAAVTEYRVRVRNLTYMQPFSPVLVVAHTSDVALFQEGLPANDAIKLMAEDGDNSALLVLAGSDEVAPFICGAAVDEAPLLPGETTRLSLMVDDEICGDDANFSLVSMLINTNDAFVGIDTADLETTKVFPPAYDAGTEENNELCNHIPGPACDPNSGNMEAGPGEGYIHIQRGVHGIADLTASVYDWRNPVAEVFVASA